MACVLVTSLPCVVGESRCAAPARVQICSRPRRRACRARAAASGYGNSSGSAGSSSELAEAWRRVRPPHSGYHWDGTPRRFFEVHMVLGGLCRQPGVACRWASVPLAAALSVMHRPIPAGMPTPCCAGLAVLQALAAHILCHLLSPITPHLQGWYFKVTLPGDGQSFALIYSIEDPAGGNRCAGVGAQVMGPDDGYLLQFSPQVGGL